MSRLRAVPAPRRLSTAEQVEAVFSSPALYELAQLIPRPPVGRPPANPAYVVLGYGVLARLYRSGIRVQTELAHPATWQLVHDTVARMAQQLPEGLVPRPPGDRPATFEAFRNARDRYLTDPDIQVEVQARFIDAAVRQARSFGLLRPEGPGSLCHPDRSRTIYGDGTVVRPLYRPPAARREIDPETGEVRVVYLDAAGEPIEAPARRFDPDVAEYHGHAGPVFGQNFVQLSVRGDGPQQRVVLAVDRVPRPGAEADTSVELIKQVHAVVGKGIQAVAYDGAFQGPQVDEVMTSTGLIVINKVPSAPRSRADKDREGEGKVPRWFPLGVWEHDTPAGACGHSLAAVNGAVSEIGLDEAGEPVILGRLDRTQVKRSRRSSGLYHFNVAYRVPCPAGELTAWVTPHGEAGDPDHRRAGHVRVIAEGEPDFTRLYGLRNDAESWNSMLKRSLLVERAASLGGARQLVDVLCFALLHNAITAYQAALAADARPASRRAA
jgi:hypothetical protein